MLELLVQSVLINKDVFIVLCPQNTVICNYLRNELCPRETAQQLRSLATVAVDPGSSPRTHTAAPNCL